MNTTQKQLTKAKGFTIIEVVLVLAIAGLIFLMVLVALPALQRGQRDTARKNDVSTVVGSLQSYLSNNRGSFSAITNQTTLDTFTTQYIKNLSQYDVPAKITYKTLPADQTFMSVYTGNKCDTNNSPTTTGASTRNAAVVTKLEQSNALFCQDL